MELPVSYSLLDVTFQVDLVLLAAHQVNALQSLPPNPKEVDYLAADQEITQIATNAVVTMKVTAVASLKAVDLVATVAPKTAVHPAKLTIEKEQTAKVKKVMGIRIKEIEAADSFSKRI